MALLIGLAWKAYQALCGMGDVCIHKKGSNAADLTQNQVAFASECCTCRTSSHTNTHITSQTPDFTGQHASQLCDYPCDAVVDGGYEYNELRCTRNSDGSKKKDRCC